MCDLFGTAGAAKKVANENAKQSELNRAAEAANAAELRAAQEQQGAQTRQLEQERINQQQRLADESRAAAEAEANRIREAEVRRQQNIAEGQNIISQMFGQFDDGFYNNRSQSYTDYAKPQLDTQYQEAMQNLVRSLSRSGNLNSSVRGKAMADMQGQYDKGILSITDQGKQYANQARSSIEQARGNLLAQNSQLADPGQVRNLATSQVAGLSTMPSYTPLATLIQALTSSATPSTTDSAKGKPTTGVDLFNSAPESLTGTVVA